MDCDFHVFLYTRVEEIEVLEDIRGSRSTFGDQLSEIKSTRYKKQKKEGLPQ